MKISRVSSGVGAVVSDVDIRDLSVEETSQLDAAWADHGVLFLRDQHLDPAQQLAFAERFSPADINRYFTPVDGHPAVAMVLKEPDQRLNIGGGWHADHSYDEEPARGSVLYALETPPTGGDTLFADAVAAAAALSEGMRTTLAGLRAVHSTERVFSANSPGMEEVEDRLSVGPEIVSTHPVLAAHPMTGRDVLYVNPGFTLRFDGWTEQESLPLLRQLYDHVTQPQFTTRFSWQPGSIAMWDNRCVWHWAVNDYPGHRRLMHRVTIKGTPIHGASEAKQVKVNA